MNECVYFAKIFNFCSCTQNTRIKSRKLISAYLNMTANVTVNYPLSEHSSSFLFKFATGAMKFLLHINFYTNTMFIDERRQAGRQGRGSINLPIMFFFILWIFYVFSFLHIHLVFYFIYLIFYYIFCLLLSFIHMSEISRSKSNGLNKKMVLK